MFFGKLLWQFFSFFFCIVCCRLQSMDAIYTLCICIFRWITLNNKKVQMRESPLHGDHSSRTNPFLNSQCFAVCSKNFAPRSKLFPSLHLCVGKIKMPLFKCNNLVFLCSLPLLSFYFHFYFCLHTILLMSLFVLQSPDICIVDIIVSISMYIKYKTIKSKRITIVMFIRFVTTHWIRYIFHCAILVRGSIA